MEKISYSGIIKALLESIDLINYLLKHHHRRVAYISYELGREMGLSQKQLSNLVLASAVHDIGALYVKERNELIHLDVHEPHHHAIRGAVLLGSLKYFDEIANIVLHHHRYFNQGQGKVFVDKEVPIESFVIHLADRVEIMYDRTKSYSEQSDTIYQALMDRTPNIFHPDVIQAFNITRKREVFWLDLEHKSFRDILNRIDISQETEEGSFDLLEEIAVFFSKVIDSRSAFTASHSYTVGEVSYALGKMMNLPEEHSRKIKIAGLLHDIGKLGVPNEIIEKNEALTEEEYETMKSHAYYTNEILKHLEGMADICRWASMHHEKHDGSGYPFHAKSDEISLEIDILTLADIYSALTEERPYRKGCHSKDVIQCVENEIGSGINQELMNQFRANIRDLELIRESTQVFSYREYYKEIKKINQMTDQIH